MEAPSPLFFWDQFKIVAKVLDIVLV